MEPVNKWTIALTSLSTRIENAYLDQWAHPAEGKPGIIFDKESCCKPPLNENHNVWWVYVQPRALPSVVGRGKTLEIAMASLLDQLVLGPQHGTQNDASTTGQETIPKKATKKQRKAARKAAMLASTAAEKAGVAYVRDYHLRSKAGDQSNPNVFISLPDLPAGSSVLPVKPAALPSLQLSQPGPSSLPLDTTQTTSVGSVSPIEEDSRRLPDGTLTKVAPLQWKMHLRDFSTPRDTLTPTSSNSIGHPTTHAPGADFERYPTVPNLFRFSSSHDLLASLSREPVLHKTKEKEEPKPGIKSGLVREGDAWKQDHKKADLLRARQDLDNQIKPLNYVSSSSSHQGQAQREVKLSSPRQKPHDRQRPFLFASPNKPLPGDTALPSSLGRFAFGSTARVPPSAKVEPPAAFPSLDSKKDINAFTFQAAQISPVSSQYRSKIDDGPSVGQRSCGPNALAQELQDRVKRESSVSPVGQKYKKIKVEETGQLSEFYHSDCATTSPPLQRLSCSFRSSSWIKKW